MQVSVHKCFYAHSNGYKMQLLVYPNGCSDTHLSVYLCLPNGPHDDQLTWPLKRRFYLQLVNQINNGHHHSYIVTYDSITPNMSANRVAHNGISTGWGQINFISLQVYYKVTHMSRMIMFSLEYISNRIDELTAGNWYNTNILIPLSILLSPAFKHDLFIPYCSVVMHM